MSAPEGTGPQPDYAIQPGDMEDGIRRFLDPVITGLHKSQASFSSAHGDVQNAHDATTPGWFGGQGSGDVRAACSSFLNEVAYQLDQLSQDQSGLVGSLEEYKQVLQGHISMIRNTEERNANLFRDIHRELLEGGK